VVIDDAREYIFPIFSVRTETNGVLLASRAFLGTAFFVSRRGDAITEGHVLPAPRQLEEGRRLVAIVVRNGSEEVCWVRHAAKFASWDVALLHVNLPETKHLAMSVCEVPAGSDIEIIGITNHEVWAAGKEMRILKGHVTMAPKRLELSCAVPTGMSGSPVFLEGKVVGYATGTVRSEEVEESSEEIAEISDREELVRITEVRRALYYGLAFPFSAVADAPEPILDGKTLPEFIRSRNDEP